MKNKWLGLIRTGLVVLIWLAGSASIAQSQEERARDWRERRREAEAVESRVALEARLVKLEEGLANERRRADWMEKVVWGAIVGILGLFGREVLSVYFNRQHRRQPDRDSQTGPE